MKESDTNGLQTSVTTDETTDQNHRSGSRMAHRQFLAAAAVAVSVTASSESTEADKSGSFNSIVEWKASGVWNDHLVPARNALIRSGGVDVVEAKEELREALQKLEAMGVADESR